MNLEDITQIGVVGAGTMGAGIAELFAESSYEVTWYNRSEVGIQRGLTRIRSNQATLIRPGVLTQLEAEAALARLHSTTDMMALASVDLISESVAEDLKLKHSILKFFQVDHCTGQKK
jgi:3-hydroxybutyryl-CoA dehydrogenase